MDHASFFSEATLIEIGVYNLFDGLAYNMCGYFVSCLVFFLALQRRGKIQAVSKQNVSLCYMLNHQLRGLFFHYKRNGYFANGFYFLVRVFGSKALTGGGGPCRSSEF